MAGKKIPTIEDSVNKFKDIISRAKLESFVFSNHTMIASLPTGGTVLIIPDITLWNAIIDDEELKSKMVEYSNEYEKYKNLFIYGNDIQNKLWLDVDINTLSDGRLIHIKIEEYEYEIPINKSLIPVKLKKAEFNNISYRISRENGIIVLVVRKEFSTDVADCNFNMLTLFHIV